MHLKCRLVLLILGVIAFSCTKEYSYEGGSSPFAEGTLKDSAGDCLQVSAIGSFYKGVTPGADTNYVELRMNITHAGLYNISTDIQNGFRFADSGHIYNTGDTVIRLKPIGIPVDTGATFFTVSFDNDACYFYVQVKENKEENPGDWQFTEDSFVFNGNFNSSLKDNPTGLATNVILDGSTFSGDTTLSVDFLIYADDVEPGTYTTQDNEIIFAMFDATNSGILYTSDASAPETEMTIVVTEYNAATGEMKGTFSGTVKAASGALVPITNGSFNVTFP